MRVTRRDKTIKDMIAVTPHDTNEISRKHRCGIYCYTAAGTVTVIFDNGNTGLYYIGQYEFFDIRANIIKATGTTATGLSIYTRE